MSPPVRIRLRPGYVFFISALRPLTVTVELDALDVEPSRRQTYVATLVRLVAVQPAPRRPLAVHIFSFLCRQDADLGRARRVCLEDDDEPRAGDDEFVRRGGDDQPAGRFERLTGLRRRRALVGHVQRVPAESHTL